VILAYNIYWYSSSLDADCQITEQKPGADAEKIGVFREDLGNLIYSGGAAQALRSDHRNQKGEIEWTPLKIQFGKHLRKFLTVGDVDLPAQIPAKFRAI